jgi:DNA-binding Lrp family transcriptional regulator
VIAAYILIQAEAGQAATVTAALRDLPGVSETACLTRPYDVIARVEAQDIHQLATLVASRVQVLDGVTRTMTCPVVHLLAHPCPRQSPHEPGCDAESFISVAWKTR